MSGNGRLASSSTDTKQRTMRQKPTVHFELDLADPIDHKTAVVLVERAIKVMAGCVASVIRDRCDYIDGETLGAHHCVVSVVLSLENVCAGARRKLVEREA